MSGVKRYSHFHGGHNERADFVLASDYGRDVQALIDERGQLRAENERLRTFAQQMARQQGEPYFRKLAKAALSGKGGDV
jgi:hypothetical protein